MICKDNIHFPDHMRVAIIGAGPAGLGVARVLRDLAIPDVWVLERGKVGQSFLNWPSGTKLLTPSFAGNVFGMTDLNAISFDSSPGWSLRREHPDGLAYAQYLEHAAVAFGINVQCGVEAQSILPEGEGFALVTNHGQFTADFVIWACGQFSAPSDGDLPGAELAIHYGQVRNWQDVPGEEVFIIGGYESGIDAAIGLARAGKHPIVLDSGAPWLGGDKDPSKSLSPYTLQRLDEARETAPITLIPDAEIIALDQEQDGIHILAADGRSWLSTNTPILATGFGSGTAPVSEYFDYDDNGSPLLSSQDESAVFPGLFLVGPEVSHNGHLFCFIYKFRQRFAVVARAIAARMGVDTSPLEIYYENNMFLDDLSCCDDDMCLC
ncbi:NAD(P)-binding domain-containing protein [Shimia sp. MIT910701]|jgi:thioredoxin reductase|uniref:NAD(P)/FAD-dependent oxidoreductase n=1 Tax=Shimia sp. MIT910701 TaxID=3096987 RepID=UPI003999543D